MKKLEVFNPFNLEKIIELEITSEETCMQYLSEADEIYKDRSRWMPAYKRIEILEKTCEIIKSKRDELAMQAAREGGKPLQDSMVEINRGIEGIKVAIEEISNLKGTEITMGITPKSHGKKAFTIKEPRGVVMAISAFNHPFNLIVHQVIPAVATGCPVLVKPAKTTPMSCISLLEALYEAGLPKEYARLVLCENNVAEKLVSDPRTAFFTFIGSSRVGWMLRSKLPPGATCALEHGGVAPVIMEKSADWKSSIAPLVKGGFYHAGQVCVSVQRVYVHESFAKEFTNEFVASAKKLKVGAATESDTEVGPLILPGEVERVESWVNQAVEQGAELLCGGKRLSDTTFEPTVLLNPSEESNVSTKEIFGPVVCLYTYSDKEDALKRANSLNVSFQASVFSKDLDEAFDLANRLNAVAVMINDHSAFRVDWMPFGGVKESGSGMGGIGYTMEEMLQDKMLVITSKAFT